MKKFFLLYFLVAILITASAQTFIRELSPGSAPNSSSFEKGISYSNGNYLTVQSIQQSYPYSTFLTMLNSIGDTLWTRQIDSLMLMTNDYRATVTGTYEGGCMLLSGGLDVGGGAFHLIKIDSAGNHLWSKKYLFTSGDVDTLIRVAQTKDSGFVFMGRTGVQWWTYGFSFIKVNKDGDILWLRRYIAMDEEITDFREDDNGGFYFIGRYNNSSTLTKVDSAGIFSWRKKYNPSSGTLSFNEIASLRNDTILIQTGHYYNRDGVVELSGSGDFINAVSIDSGYNPVGSLLCLNGNIALVRSDKFMMLDPQMNLLWTKKINVNVWMYADAFDVTERSDGGFWVFGNYNKFTTTGMFFLSVDSAGRAPCFVFDDTCYTSSRTLTVDSMGGWTDVQIPFQVSTETRTFSSGASVAELCNVSNEDQEIRIDLSLFPNPASSRLEVGSWQLAIRSLQLISLMGEVVLSEEFAGGVSSTTIYISSLSSGIYFVKAELEKGTSVKKFVVNH